MSQYAIIPQPLSGFLQNDYAFYFEVIKTVALCSYRDATNMLIRSDIELYLGLEEPSSFSSQQRIEILFMGGRIFDDNLEYILWRDEHSEG